MIPTSQIDPRISAHLAPDEQVLWQGGPRANTFFGPKEIAGAAALAGGGVALAAGLLDSFIPALAGVTGAARLVPALAAIVAAGLIAQRNWARRGALWAYAITDRRLISVLGERLIRSLRPAELDVTTLKISGDTVFWVRSPRDSDNHSVPDMMRRGPDHPLIGFNGQADPQALRERILTWRRSLTDIASAQAAEFLATRAEDPTPASQPEPQPQRASGQYRHDPSGVCLDFPLSWEVTVQTRTSKSLRLFGAKVSPDLVNETEPEPYVGGAGWNLIRAVGAPDTHITLYIREGALERSLQSVLDDPWSGVAGLKPLDQTPELQLPGGYQGFALRRITPGGAGASDSVLHQAWLSDGRHVLEVQGTSPADRPELNAVIDAIIRSIRG